MLQTIEIKLQSQGRSLAQPLPWRIAPSHEIQRLHLFVGTWSIEGETHASVDAPAVKVTGVDTYEWMAGKFFLVYHANGHMGNEESNALLRRRRYANEFIGYDPSSQTYTCHCFNSRGNSDLFQANLHDHTWTIEGKSARFTGMFNSIGNTLTGQWEQSSDGLNWLPCMDVRAVLWIGIEGKPLQLTCPVAWGGNLRVATRRVFSHSPVEGANRRRSDRWDRDVGVAYRR